jgi:hypothetical protein
MSDGTVLAYCPCGGSIDVADADTVVQASNTSWHPDCYEMAVGRFWRLLAADSGTIPAAQAMYSVHQRVGWFNCANLNCRKDVGQDHVTVTTTTQMRRFCCMECVGEGLEAWRQHIYASVDSEPPTDYEGDLALQYQRSRWHTYETIPLGSSSCADCGKPTGQPNRYKCDACLGSVADMMATVPAPWVERFAREQLQLLETLPPCGRCLTLRALDGDTKCDKCFDTAWDITTGVSVTCGCGCWSRSQIEAVIAGQDPAQGDCEGSDDFPYPE